MTDERENQAPRPHRTVLGVSGRVAGVVGGIVSLVAVVAVLLGRAWVNERLDEIGNAVDAGIDKGGDLLVATRARTETTSQVVASLGESARARLEGSGPVAERVRTMRAKAADLSDRYGTVRASYADAHERLVSAFDRLNTLDRLAPAISFPQAPADALTAIDESVLALDAKVLELIRTLEQADEGNAMEKIEGAVERVGSLLTQVATGLSSTKVRLDGLRTRAAARMDAARSMVTWVSIALVLLFLYGLLLHGVLYRSSGRWLRGGAAREPAS